MKTFIIGCGSIGLRHAENLKQLGYTIDYIFDIDNDKASKISDKFHATKIKNTIEGMKKSDVVFICTPPDTHTKYIKQAITYQSHVFCEKPISNDKKNLIQILKEADRKNIQIMIGYMLRFHPGLIYVKDLINSGSIGKILGGQVKFGYLLSKWRPEEDYRKNYFATNKTGGGIILDASHEIDYVRWIFDEIKSVFCISSKVSDLEIETQDYAAIIFETISNQIVEIHLDCVDYKYQRSCRILGSEGSINWDFNGKISFNKNNSSKEITKNYILNDLYIREVEHFMKTIKLNQKNISDGWNGLKTLDLALASISSSKTGKKLSV